MYHSTENRPPSLLLLSIASGLSPFGMAIVVPALNGIALAFDADFGAVQFVISAYLFGLAMAQPLSGFLCDRFGRRPVMLWGFGFFVIASLLCAFAPSLSWLVVGRCFQAMGVSVGTVASRAILRDCYDRNRMAEAMSTVAAVMGFAPIMAPVFGGALVASAGFRSIFIAAAVIGAIVFVCMLRMLKETLPADAPRPRVQQWLASYGGLLSSRPFVGNTLMFGFVQGSFFCFLTIGAALFEATFNIGAGKFGVLWGLMAVTYVIGAAIAARMTPRIGTQAVMRFSVSAGVIAGLCVWLAATTGDISLLRILMPLGVLMALAGAITPGAMAGAVAPHPTIAGTASGLSSAAGLVIGGSFSVIAGHIYAGDYAPIALVIFLSSCAVAASWLLANGGKKYVTA